MAFLIIQCRLLNPKAPNQAQATAPNEPPPHHSSLEFLPHHTKPAPPLQPPKMASTRSITESSRTPPHPSPSPHSLSSILSRSLCSRPSNAREDGLVPTPIDYRCLLQEDEFHQLADSTIHDLQQNLEEYGDRIQIDGFDVDYGNQVLTLKLGDLGTYVLNKQTPNRQIWLSSPVSGPSRFDWERSDQAWVYQRNKWNLSRLLEESWSCFVANRSASLNCKLLYKHHVIRRCR
ncbi:hypothetical protein Droror1_Dr00019369 [Drosera rotundifolia]